MKLDISLDEFYAHPVDKVWAAIATREGLSAWLMDTDFAPEPGQEHGHEFAFRYQTEAGETGTIDCEVLEISPPHRMVWSWGSPEFGAPTRVEIDLAAEGNGTRLRLRHTGDRPEEMVAGYTEGWAVKAAQIAELLDAGKVADRK